MGLFSTIVGGNILTDGDIFSDKKTKGNPIDNIKDAIDPISIVKRYLLGLSEEEAISKLEKGDHIYAQRIGYTHHGIYIGSGRVIHYLNDGVQKDSIYTFADGGKISCVNKFTISSNGDIVRRAKSRLYEDKYNVIWRNCEQFAIWCRNGN